MPLDHHESPEELRRELLKQTLRDTGAVILRSNRTSGLVEKGSVHNFVTEGDLQSEAIIKTFVAEHYPEDELLSEEATSALEDPLQAPRLWIADPLDGTNNFRYKRNHSSISLAYAEQGQVIMGGAFNPFTGELFFAERGNGAFLNGKPIRVSEKKGLGQSCVLIENSYDAEESRWMLDVIRQMEHMPWFRSTGSAVLALCEIADARSDLLFHPSLKPWDTAAAMLIIEEAGGKATAIDGQPATFMTPDIIAGNAELVAQYADYLARCGIKRPQRG